MAQLGKDSFAAGEGPMTVEEGVALLAARIASVEGVESLPLAEADRRVLAAPVIAPIDLPPYDNSAVDGYAVRLADLSPDAATRLPVAARLAAGMAGAAMQPATAVRIFTGAPVPAGADTVFMQEDCHRDGDAVVLPPGLPRGANVRVAGEDAASGSEVLPAGRRIVPQDVALLAALGIETVTVRRRLKVAVFSTGDEVLSPGAPLRPGALYDSNRFALIAMLGRIGCEVADLGILADRQDGVAQAVRRAAAACDLVVTSGGVSMGEEDHVRAALASVGSLVFWKLAIKPGRPVAMGIVEGTPVVGLPGNPVAVYVTFAHVVRPLVAALAGEAYRPPVPMPVRAGFSYRKKAGRREFLRASLVPQPDGNIVAVQHPREGAAAITSLTETDGFVVLPEPCTQVDEGHTVAFFAYDLLR
jgi:molybdopterin molybdotransferase